MRQNCGKGPREYQGTSAAFSVWFTEAFSRQGCQDPTQSFLSASWLVSYLLICEPTKFEGQENLHQCGLSHLIQDSIIHASTVQFSSVQFSRSVVSDSLWPHESQHARPPCPSPTPGVHSKSRPSSRWCHPAISSSVVPFSSCPQSLPASESFPMSGKCCIHPLPIISTDATL